MGVSGRLLCQLCSSLAQDGHDTLPDQADTGELEAGLRLKQQQQQQLKLATMTSLVEVLVEVPPLWKGGVSGSAQRPVWRDTQQCSCDSPSAVPRENQGATPRLFRCVDALATLKQLGKQKANKVTPHTWCDTRSVSGGPLSGPGKRSLIGHVAP